ncbi:MAG: hypothetical protein IMW89_10225 [Ktedonobacteraceae bacterium]|nr:hypothetical protein [Ktedonobacteraceae bacterium]
MWEPEGRRFDDEQGYDIQEFPYVPDQSGMHYVPPEQSSESTVQSPSRSYSPSEAPSQPALPHAATLQAGAGASAEKIAVSSRRPPTLLIVLSSVVALLIIGAAAVFTYTYFNRSTPMKTLDAFCQSLQQENYHGAYNAFSKSFQTSLTEQEFTSILSQDKVVTCTHGQVDDTQSKAVTSLKLVHRSQGVNNDIVTLTKDENNEWKISDLQAQS